MIQIYFQRGTFEGVQASFWTDLLIASLGAFIGIFGAYLIYRLSIKQTREDRLKYVSALLESIIPNSLQQSANCLEQAGQTSANPFNMPNLKLVANRDHNRLAEKVDQEGVFHSYLAKYSRNNSSYRNFRMIFAYIDYLDYLFADMISFNLKTNELLWERKKEYAAAYRSANEKIETIMLDQNLENLHPDYAHFLHKIYTDLALDKIPGENVVHSYKNFILPVRNYIIHNGPKTPPNTELMFLLNSTMGHYTGIEKEAQQAAIDFEDYGIKLKDITEKLKVATEQLRKDYAVN